MKLAFGVTAVAVTLVACHAAPAPPPAARPQLVFGLALPWGPAVGIERARVATAYLAKALDADVVPKLFSYEELARALDDGKVDIAFIPPFGYVKAAAGGRLTLVRRATHEGLPDYRAVLFTRRDSAIKSLDDLKGKDVAWVREGSASGNLFPRAWLLQHHLQPATFFAHEQFLGSHNDVCRAVYTGEAWAGASFTDARTDFDHAKVDGCEPALGDKVSDLKIVFATDPIPNDVIAVSAKLSPALTAKLAHALDQLPGSEDGRRVLRDGFASEGFVAVSDADFNVVRQALAVLEPPAKDGGR